MPLPTGRITMLFTDIEGSTRLLRTLGHAYAEVLSDQRTIMRSAITAHGGHEMGTEGDSFFVVFASAAAGLGAAIDAQRGLGANEWPLDATVRVRMGLHVGEPGRHDEGYMGLDVNRAARIASTANGAQVVVSADLHAEMVATELVGVTYRDLGFHRLKDLPEPEHIFQLVVADLTDVTTPIKSLGTPTNLPPARARLVGRDELVADVRRLVLAGSRVLTLTGPGGTGKTSVALACARTLADHFIDGVYFVDLEHARTAESAWDSIASALGHDGADDAANIALGEVTGRSPLLVLDNLEQLPAAGSVVSALLDHTELVVIATSRGPLRVRDEQEVPVPPLALATQHAPFDELAAAPAVELFVREARRARPTFELNEINAATVAAICWKLQGLPLAIELAAARIRMLSPQQLDVTLTEQLSLTSTDVDRPDRQRTLAAAIAWSYDLLTPTNQEAFVGLGVFADGCDLGAAAAVLPGEAEGFAAFDVVSALAGVGLVTLADGPDGGARISMLTAIHEFARTSLATSARAEVVRQRHARYYTSLAEEAEAQAHGPHHLLWSDRLTIEGANFAAAFEWTTSARGDQALALRLASALGWFWYTHGRATEGRTWLERAVAAAGTATETSASVDSRARAKGSHALGVLQQQQGDNDAAAASFERALALWRAEGDDVGVSQELNSLGVTQWSLAQPATARALLEESAAVARACGSDHRLASALSNLGIVALSGGAVDDAIASFEEALVIDRRLADAWGIAVDQSNLAAALIGRGDVEKGHRLATDILDAVVELDDPELLASTIEVCATAVSATSDAQRTARLVGAADAIRAAAQVPRAPLDEAYLETAVAAARAALDPADYIDARRHGGELSEHDVLTLARAPLVTPTEP